MTRPSLVRERPPYWPLQVFSVGSFFLSIVLANWLIRSFGSVVLSDGSHLVPVGFGLNAPSGVYAAGFSLVARDLVQRTAGRRWSVMAILAGTLLTTILSPRLAIASGTAFLFSELADFAIFSPLQQKGLTLAVLLSGLAGAVVDGVIFLSLAGIPFAVALPGLLLGKAWMQLLGAAGVAGLRRTVPRREVMST